MNKQETRKEAERRLEKYVSRAAAWLFCGRALDQAMLLEIEPDQYGEMHNTIFSGGEALYCWTGVPGAFYDIEQSVMGYTINAGPAVIRAIDNDAQRVHYFLCLDEYSPIRPDRPSQEPEAKENILRALW